MASARRILFWRAGSREGEGICGGCGGGVGSGETALRTPKPELGSADMAGKRSGRRVQLWVADLSGRRG